MYMGAAGTESLGGEASKIQLHFGWVGNSILYCKAVLDGFVQNASAFDWSRQDSLTAKKKKRSERALLSQSEGCNDLPLDTVG